MNEVILAGDIATFKILRVDIVLTFIGNKQTNTKTDKQADKPKFYIIDAPNLPLPT